MVAETVTVAGMEAVLKAAMAEAAVEAGMVLGAGTIVVGQREAVSPTRAAPTQASPSQPAVRDNWCGAKLNGSQ